MHLHLTRWSLVALVITAGCARREEPTQSSLAPTYAPLSTPRGVAVVDRARELFGGRDDARAMLAPASGSTWVAAEGSFRFANRVSVTTPATASGSLLVDAGAMRVTVTPSGLEASAIEWGDGLAVFPDVAEGTHLLRRVDATGVEDLYQVERARDEIVFRAEVALEGVAGLRLVDGALELLDEGGAPRLRSPAPIVFDARGERRRGAIEVHGCAYDASPRGPWGRAVTAPGASTCTIVARVDGRSLAYPVLVDPAWETTASSAYTHFRHNALLLGAGADAGKVLVAGGGGSLSLTTELFDPASRTWATAAPLPVGTDLQDGSRAVELSDGTVVLAGGLPSATTSPAAKTTVLRSPSTGAWTAGKDMNVGRGFHALQVVTIAGKERVVAAGGQPKGAVLSTDPPIATAEIYAPETDTWTYLSGLKIGRTKMASAVLGDGRMVLLGGEYMSGSSVKWADTTEYYDAAIDGWLSGPKLTTWRSEAAAALVAPGSSKVLLAGGYGGSTLSGTLLDSAEVVDFASGGAAAAASGKLILARKNATATRLLDGRVVLAGGDTAAFTVTPTQLVDLWVPETGAGKIVATASLVEARAHHAAVGLPSGSVLLSGGWGGSSSATQKKSAELFDLDLGKTCGATSECPSGRFCVDGVCCATSACGAGETCASPGREGLCVKPQGAACGSGSECATGFCADGVCCAEACVGACRSCALPGSVGTCTLAAAGTDPRVSCRGSSDPTCAKTCDGTGKCGSSYAPAGTPCGTSLDPDAGLPFCSAYTCTTSGSCTLGTNKCGLTCVSSSLCNESTKSCTVTGTINANTCLIDGKCYAKGQTKDGDMCSICDPDSTNTAWTASLGCDAGPIDAGTETGSDAAADADAQVDADATSDAPQDTAVVDDSATDSATASDATADSTAPSDDAAADDASTGAADALPEASACSCSVPGSTGSGSSFGALGALGLLGAVLARRRRVLASAVAATVLGCSASADRTQSGGPTLDAGLDATDVSFDGAEPSFDVGTSDTDVDETLGDASCAGKEVAAPKPMVDIVMVVDQSGSMSGEIVQVKTNVNKLAEQLDKAYLDYRVIMIAKRGTGSYEVCVPPPLGGPSCASNPPVFRSSNQEVQSTDALTRILETYDSLLPSLGWRDMLREDSMKVFVPVTDDNATAPKAVPPATTSVAQQFDAELLKRSAAFGNATKRRYRFYPICGASAADPYVTCGSGMVNTGSTYIELTKIAGGKHFPLCAPDYGPLFIDMAKALAGEVACEIAIPEPPPGEKLDYDKVNVVFAPSDSTKPEELVSQDTSAACEAGANGWQYNADKTKVVLCGDACTRAKDDLGSRVKIQFGCKTRID